MKIGRKVKFTRSGDGVKITWGRFGQAVGATGASLKDYYRRSEGKNSDARANEQGFQQRAQSEIRRLSTPARVRLTQELLADPEVADQALDPYPFLDRNPHPAPTPRVNGHGHHFPNN